MTPVLSGGKLTYSGSANAVQKADTEDYKNNENATLSWSTEHVLANVYDQQVPRLWADDTPEPAALDARGLGTWHQSISVRYWDSSTDSYHWEANLQRDRQGRGRAGRAAAGGQDRERLQGHRRRPGSDRLERRSAPTRTGPARRSAATWGSCTPR